MSAEPTDNVKLDGFTVLTKEPARDGSLAHILVAQFLDVKQNNTDMRLKYCAALANSEFKWEIVGALADYGLRQPIPISRRWPAARCTATGIPR